MRILVLTGAGVSAESGIPTFRGKDGYWRNLDPAKFLSRAVHAVISVATSKSKSDEMSIFRDARDARS